MVSQFAAQLETPEVDIALVSAAVFNRACKDAGMEPILLRAIHSEVAARAAALPPLHPSIPEEYAEFADVFDEIAADSLPEHRPYDLKIDLEEGASPPLGRIYPLSEKEGEVSASPRRPVVEIRRTKSKGKGKARAEPVGGDPDDGDEGDDDDDDDKEPCERCRAKKISCQTQLLAYNRQLRDGQVKEQEVGWACNKGRAEEEKAPETAAGPTVGIAEEKKEEDMEVEGEVETPAPTAKGKERAE
ncbi:hypothetical protein LENED_002476 [Lentinula edodes]|uniref:Uncharacterized protein n=1 Tax=Lentinula edodes TaxID=5353 RepID=A0A1Q3E103_LENED|nr:hypothetical protein LENED_002476 [Lentinula edodes]